MPQLKGASLILGREHWSFWLVLTRFYANIIYCWVGKHVGCGIKPIKEEGCSSVMVWRRRQKDISKENLCPYAHNWWWSCQCLPLLPFVNVLLHRKSNSLSVLSEAWFGLQNWTNTLCLRISVDNPSNQGLTQKTVCFSGSHGFLYSSIF